MRIDKDHLPVKIDVPGATARLLDVGSAAGTLCAEHFALDAGTDLAPLLAGLDDDACHSAHWGYVIHGDVVVTYLDRTSERCRTGDLFHWPPGHTVRADDDTEMVLFSSQDEHCRVLDHVLTRLTVLGAT